MFGFKFYFLGIAVVIYIVYLIIALGIYKLFYSSFLKRRIVKKSTLKVLNISILSVILLLPIWNSIIVSLQASYLCNKNGGMRVYKTVEVDGLIHMFRGNYWLDKGYSYSEYKENDKKYRVRYQDDELIITEVPEFKSEYWLKGDKEKNLSDYITVYRSYVENRFTKEILSELIWYRIKPASIDQWVAIEFVGWECGAEAPDGKGSHSPNANPEWWYTGNDLIQATLLPNSNY